jgi:hypothetical protein
LRGGSVRRLLAKGRNGEQHASQDKNSFWEHCGILNDERGNLKPLGAERFCASGEDG